MARRPVKWQRPEFKLRPHPSGRPKAPDNYRALGFRRLPPDEPLTPGLRRRDLGEAIGFHAEFIRPYDED